MASEQIHCVEASKYNLQLHANAFISGSAVIPKATISSSERIESCDQFWTGRLYYVQRLWAARAA